MGELGTLGQNINIIIGIAWNHGFLHLLYECLDGLYIMETIIPVECTGSYSPYKVIDQRFPHNCRSVFKHVFESLTFFVDGST